jgi:hypothetical protein
MNMLLDLRPRQWNLFISPRQKQNHLLAAIAYLAQRSPLIVFDCGRQFDSSVIARAAHGRTEIIDRIKIQRAFICYEAVKLLEQTSIGKTPILILDFLSTFYDENVRMNTRKYLLENSLHHFQRLSRGAGLAVSAYLPPASSDALYLFERLKSAAPGVLTYESSVDTSSQLSLF